MWQPKRLSLLRRAQLLHDSARLRGVDLPPTEPASRCSDQVFNLVISSWLSTSQGFMEVANSYLCNGVVTAPIRRCMLLILIRERASEVLRMFSPNVPGGECSCHLVPALGHASPRVSGLFEGRVHASVCIFCLTFLADGASQFEPRPLTRVGDKHQPPHTQDSCLLGGVSKSRSWGVSLQ